MTNFRPMFATELKADDYQKLKFPLLWSPMLGGIRVLVTKTGPVTKSMNLVPNVKLRKFLANPALLGMDGEVFYGGYLDPKVFYPTLSAVTRVEGADPVAGGLRFIVYDDFTNPDWQFKTRYQELAERIEALPPELAEHVRLCPYQVVDNDMQLSAIEGMVVRQGFDGLHVRSFEGPYKSGFPTVRQGIFLRIKRYLTGEGIVDGMDYLKDPAFRKHGNVWVQSPLFPESFRIEGVSLAITDELIETRHAQAEGGPAARVRFKYLPYPHGKFPSCPVLRERL